MKKYTSTNIEIVFTGDFLFLKDVYSFLKIKEKGGLSLLNKQEKSNCAIKWMRVSTRWESVLGKEIGENTFCIEKSTSQ